MYSVRQILRFTFITSFIIALLGVCLSSIILALINNGRIAYGVHFEDIPLNGLTREETSLFLQKEAKRRLSKNAVLISTGARQWEISPQEIQLTANIEATEAKAYAIGREGSFLHQLKENIAAAFYGRRIEFVMTYDKAALTEKLQQIAKQVNQKPQNAVCYLTADGIGKKPAVIGREVDTELLGDNIENAILHLELPYKTTLPIQETSPFVTDESITDIDSILASSTTYFNPSAANRSENIYISAAAINHQLITSGTTFSFNTVVGRRIPDSGYKEAPVILNGQSAQDFGGGVCQVSSTLYNAALLSNMTITERTPHFYPSSYIAPGLDATVADGQLDLKFLNPLPHSIYILTSVYSNTLSIFILGTKKDLNNQDISLFTQTERNGNAPVVSAYRLYRSGGQTIKQEFLHTDHYN